MDHRFGLEEVYTPPPGIPASAHIVFIHGLFGHPRKTWTERVPMKSKDSRSVQQDEQKTRQSQRDTSRNLYPGPSSVQIDKPSASSKVSLEDSEEDNVSRESRLSNVDLKGKTPSKSNLDPGFWPQELLPEVVPNARIFTWGYDADVDKFFSSASQNTIHQHAGDLLSDLADMRNGDATPIIFVAHSLGGIIVKDALNQSRSVVGSRLKSIIPTVRAVCFLGTPHRGSKAATLGKIAYRITTVATKRPNTQLLQGLEKNSETLDRIADDFTQTLLEYNIQLYSFREEKETRRYLLFNVMVVDAFSAKIGHAKEEVGSIPASHSAMSKFRSRQDVGFKRVSAQLRRWIAEITKTDDGMGPQTSPKPLDFPITDILHGVAQSRK